MLGRRRSGQVLLILLGVLIFVYEYQTNARWLTRDPVRGIRGILTMLVAVFLYRAEPWARWLMLPTVFYAGKMGLTGIFVGLTREHFPQALNGVPHLLYAMVVVMTAFASRSVGHFTRVRQRRHSG